MRIIYADSMFLLNFIIDYLLLLATGKICALPLRRWRMALGAAWGGLYAVLSVVYPEIFAIATVKILSGVGCAAIAYAGAGRFVRTAAVFFAVGAAFGGAVYATAGLGGTRPENGTLAALSLRTLILSFAICYAVLSLVFRGMGRRGARQVETIEVRLGDKKSSFRALRDTGSELCDERGNPVLTAEWAAVAPLFPALARPPDDGAELCLALAQQESMTGRCRVLPCITVIGSGGLLAAFRPDEILIGGKTAPHSLVAVSMAPIGAGGEYQALF